MARRISQSKYTIHISVCNKYYNINTTNVCFQVCIVRMQYTYRFIYNTFIDAGYFWEVYSVGETNTNSKIITYEKL